MNEQELRKTLLSVFKQEANERLLSMTNCLIAIEAKQDSDAAEEILKTIYREAHSIKGAARSIGLNAIELLFQSIESVFYGMINKKIKKIPTLFDTLITISKELRQIAISDEIETPENNSLILKFKEQLTSILSQNNSEKKEKPSEPLKIKSEESPKTPQEETPVIPKEVIIPKEEPTIEPEKEEKSVKAEKEAPIQESADLSTVRIDSAKLDKVLRDSENLIMIKQFFSYRQPVINEISSELSDTAKKIDKTLSEMNLILSDNYHTDSKRKIYSMLEKLTDISSTIGDIFVKLKDTQKRTQNLLTSEKEDYRYTGNIIDEFFNGLKEIAMVPISNVTNIFPIMAREIAQKLDKKAVLEISGDSMMLDRRILDSIKDPLMHIVRNSIDHGIETPSQRKKQNKNESGLIKISIASADSNYLEISVSDDGAGINIAKVKKRLAEKKIFTEEELEAFTEERIMNSIFMPGFSTSDIVTDLSGRGLGLSIVKENIELIGGSVSISNNQGQGSTFSIRLPVTIATYKGIIVKDSDVLFALPSSGTEIIKRVPLSEISSVENKPAITYDNRVIPLVSLAAIMGLKPSSSSGDKKNVLSAIIGKGIEQIALSIEEVLEEKEIIIKDLGKNIEKVPYISGVTVLSSGEIIPILNPRDIIQRSSSTLASFAVSNTKKSPEDTKKKKKKKILIAEDSPTSRTLIKNVLESAGFNVSTSNDGQEALTYLRTNKVDALVSDIEMPRLNGFDLTRKIRADEKLKELPVILVTSLTSREDMEKGIEAGANSYIIKSQFDQSVLVETIKSFI